MIAPRQTGKLQTRGPQTKQEAIQQLKRMLKEVDGSGHNFVRLAVDGAMDAYKLKIQPALEAVPLMSTDAFVDLLVSIKKDGLQFPVIMTDENVLVDGRCRIAAAVFAGRKFQERDIQIIDEKSDAKIASLIANANVVRRHLTQSQAALAAAKLMKAGASIEVAASAYNVAKSTVESAEHVLKNGDAKLVADVESGKVAVTVAEKAIKGTLPRSKALAVSKPESVDKVQSKLGRRAGNANVNRLLSVAEAAVELKPRQDDIVKHWPGSPEDRKKVKAAVTILRQIFEQIKDLDDVRASKKSRSN